MFDHNTPHAEGKVETKKYPQTILMKTEIVLTVKDLHCPFKMGSF